MAAELPELERLARQIIAADKVINCDFSDPTTERRYWEIDGFSKVPCGGTPVSRTGEIGLITLKRKNPGKGKERVEVFIEGLC